MTSNRKVRNGLILGLVVLLILSVGTIDFFTGFEISFSVFYLIPIVLFTVYGKPKRGFVISVALLCACTWGISEVLSNPSYSHPVIPYWNTSVRLVMFVTIGVLLFELRLKNTRLIDSNNELEILNNAVVDQKKEIEKVNQLLSLEKEKSESLLANILPEKIIETLKDNQGLIADHYDECTVMFTDFKDFSIQAEELSTKELVSELNYLFSMYDDIMEKYGIEKIKTIGDSYMSVSGVPVQKNTHALEMVLAAMEIIDFMDVYRKKRERENRIAFNIRIGIHTGPVIAGVVGKYKYAYDVWGETVNSASRFESAGEPGEINISEMSYEHVKEYFQCLSRGRIAAKNMIESNMYFVERLKPQYAQDELGRIPDLEKIYGDSNRSHHNWSS